MHWLFLIIAAIFEIGWPLGFTLSSTQPERFWAWISFAIIVGIVGLELTSK